MVNSNSIKACHLSFEIAPRVAADWIRPIHAALFYGFITILCMPDAKALIGHS